jgi:YD repeat-containing protein
MGKASGALESYAGAVESAQDQARHAIELWDQGQQATAQATTAYNQQVSAYNSAAHAYNARLSAGQNPGTKPSQPDPFSDPGEGLRTEARRVLTSARSERDAAASSAAAAIASATKLAPAEPSFWSQMGDDLSDTFSVGNLASVSFTSGVVEGAADIVKFGRSVDPMDLWNIEHPAEYITGMSGTLAGLADAAINPVDAVKGLVGTGWGSDPAQALGKLVPNVALAVATDGGGAAADASDVASSVSEDVADNTATRAASRSTGDMTRVGDPVDVATGDVVLEQTDLSLPGVLPLVLERVHQSSQRGGRWFGESWVSSLDQRLLVTQDLVAAVFADGRVLLWRRADLDGDGSGAVLPVTGQAWSLHRSPDEAYTVTDPQRGLTWRYERRQGFWQYSRGQGELPLVSLTDRAGHVATFDYDLEGRPAYVTHSGGYRVSVQITERRVTGLALGDVPLVRYEYDDSGNLAAIVNSSGQPLRLAYDAAGRLTHWADRNGHSYQYVYDELGRCVRGESPSGALSGTYGYENGVTRWTNAAGATTAYEIDSGARIAAITDPLGDVTRFSHDTQGRVTTRTDPLGRITRYAYDSLGNLLAVTRPDGSAVRTEYNDQCLPVVVAEADGGTWRQSFDAAGNRTSLTAPDGSVSVYGYDSHGHLASVAGPDGHITRYDHDQFGWVGRVTFANGSAMALTWTVEGRPVSRTLEDGTTETWTWDAEGNLIRHVSPAGAVTSYFYGAFDKVSAVQRPDGTLTEFGYDEELRLTSVVHGGLTWRYTYDPAGRLTSETDYNGAVTRYLHDPAGQLVKRVNAAGRRPATVMTRWAISSRGRQGMRSRVSAMTRAGAWC